MSNQNYGLLREINTKKDIEGYQHVNPQYSSYVSMRFPYLKSHNPTQPVHFTEPIKFRGYQTSPMPAPPGQPDLSTQIGNLGRSINTSSAQSESFGSDDIGREPSSNSRPPREQTISGSTWGFQ